MRDRLSERFGLTTDEFASRVAKHFLAVSDMLERSKDMEICAEEFLKWLDEDEEERVFKAIGTLKLIDGLFATLFAVSGPLGILKWSEVLATIRSIAGEAD